MDLAAVAGFRNSNPVGYGFGDNSFFGSQNIAPMALTMLSAAI